MSIADLLKPAGVSNPGNGGGFGTEYYFAPKDALTTQPVRDVTDKSKIVADLAFATGKRLIKLYATKETLEPVCKKAKGENKDNFGYEVSIKGSRPGVDAEAVKFITENDGAEGYIIIKKTDPSGVETMFLMGTIANPIVLDDFEMKFGTSITNSTATIPTFTTVQEMPLAVYEGDLQLTEVVAGP